MYTTSIDTALN